MRHYGAACAAGDCGKLSGDARRLQLYLPQQLARPLEVMRRVDAERHGAHEFGVDAHARLQRPQLFQLFAALQRRGRQADKRASAARR